jgi:hypothetical protein
MVILSFSSFLLINNEYIFSQKNSIGDKAYFDADSRSQSMVVQAPPKLSSILAWRASFGQTSCEIKIDPRNALAIDKVYRNHLSAAREKAKWSNGLLSAKSNFTECGNANIQRYQHPNSRYGH